MKAICRLLRDCREEILSGFDAAVKRPVGVAGLERSVLRDSLPEYLDQLAADAQGEPARAETAREHGRQRFRLGFRAYEVVREYGILCSVVLDVADRHGVHLSHREVGFLTRAMFESSAAAATEHAAQSDRARAELSAKHLGFVAHELRDPLHTAALAVQLMRRGGPRAEGALSALARSLDRVTELIDQTLVASRLEAKPPLAIATVAIEPLLSSLAAECEIIALARGIRVVVDCDRALAVEGDERLLRSTVSNLLGNALKFSREGGCVVLRARGVEGRVQLDVEDECGGLPPDQIERIFDPFVQAGSNRTGFGLGLAIARQATQAHGGTLTVHNLPGKGCVFVLDLPVVPPGATINPDRSS